MKYFNHDMHATEAHKILYSYIPGKEEEIEKFKEVKAEYDEIIQTLRDADFTNGFMTS